MAERERKVIEIMAEMANAITPTQLIFEFGMGVWEEIRFGTIFGFEKCHSNDWEVSKLDYTVTHCLNEAEAVQEIERILPLCLGRATFVKAPQAKPVDIILLAHNEPTSEPTRKVSPVKNNSLKGGLFDDDQTKSLA